MKEVDNIVYLVGMPGCGKSTIAKILSNELGYNYVDLDKFLEAKYGKTVDEAFKLGEDYFRSLETEVLKESIQFKKTIISTGGGVIKKEVNRELLKEHGIVVFIDRPVECIVTDIEISTRPLLKDGVGKIYQLYEERYDLYKAVSDVIVINDGFLRDTINKVKQSIKHIIKI